MKSNIRVVIALPDDTSITLSIAPQMTTDELRQLIQSARLIHTPNKHKELPVVGLQSYKMNIVLDYLLTSPSITVQTVHQTQKLINGENKELVNQYIFKRLVSIPDNEPSYELKLKMLYLDREKENQKGYCWFMSEMTELTFSHRSHIINSINFPISQHIQLNMTEFNLNNHRKISKRLIGSYSDIQKILTIRNKLLNLTLHHINIFGEMLQTKQTKNDFVFIFKYVPSISISLIVKSIICQISLNKLIDKIWLFLKNMISNQYCLLVYNLMKNNQLSKMLDCLHYDMEGNIFIGNINLVVEDDGKHKFDIEEERNLLKQIIEYVKMDQNKIITICQLKKSEENHNRIVSNHVFVQLFQQMKFRSETKLVETFVPILNYFEWKGFESKTVRQQTNNIVETTTMKKTKKNNEDHKKTSNGKKCKRKQRDLSLEVRSPSQVRKTKKRKIQISQFMY